MRNPESDRLAKNSAPPAGRYLSEGSVVRTKGTSSLGEVLCLKVRKSHLGTAAKWVRIGLPRFASCATALSCQAQNFPAERLFVSSRRQQKNPTSDL